jgi:sugar phosphate isomerase/epimerase
VASIPIALQLYSIRNECAEDLPGTLRAVADMGYDGVEFAGYHGFEASELRGLLDDRGLRVAGTHIGIDTLLGDELEKTVAFNAELGNRFLIVPGLPAQYTDSLDAWKRTADTFNEIAARLQPHDMFTGYHNHMHEFAPVDGCVPFELFFDNTSERVCLQPDTGNARHGGADVLPYIEKYAGRSRTVHLKEYAADNDKALVGEGDIDWQRCFQLSETVGGTEWYIVEQESYPCAPLEAVRVCLENLRNMGK